MALPKNGKTGSNVLKLDDIRNKQKKPKRATNSQTHPSKGEVSHILTPDFTRDAHPQIESEQVEERLKTELIDESTDSDVISTPAKRSLVSNRRFDKVKVERIKAELAEGSYKINYLRVADKFIEHERFG